MTVYLFKCRYFSTILVGQRSEDGLFFYVERGDGTRYRYESYSIEWARVIYDGHLIIPSNDLPIRRIVTEG